MEAIEFAVKYDDGLGVGLADADIVLVGVSRTSKTPLSMYLGYLGYKVANVPIVREIEPPRSCSRSTGRRSSGSRSTPSASSEIRQVRARLMRLSTSAYSELVEIYEELEHAAGIHRRLGCPVVDVSELSIEETAQRVLRLVERAQRPQCSRRRPREREAAVRRGAGRSGACLMAPALVLFYGVFTPIWLGVRIARLLARRRARGRSHRRGAHAAYVPRLRSARAMARYVYDFDDTAAADATLLGGKGVGPRRDDADRRSGPRGVHDHDRRLPRLHARGQANAGRARGGDRRARRAPRGARRQAPRRRRRPAARLRALGRRRLDARDDGHDPQPRPQRRRDRGPRAQDRQRALRVRLVPAADPDVRRGRRRHRRARVRAAPHRPASPRRACSRTPISTPTTCRRSSTRSSRSTSRRPAARSRRTRASS